MARRSRWTLAAVVALVMVVASTLAAGAEAQRPRQQPQRPQQLPQQPPSPRPRPNAVVRPCFVKNCVTCSARNPYVCVSCAPGYALTGSAGCNVCAPNYEQNLDDRAFSCTACPAGTSSPGGTGEASQCKPISVTSGRRLFGDTNEDLWA